jgi:hypothetical protein
LLALPSLPNTHSLLACFAFATKHSLFIQSLFALPLLPNTHSLLACFAFATKHSLFTCLLCLCYQTLTLYPFLTSPSTQAHIPGWENFDKIDGAEGVFDLWGNFYTVSIGHNTKGAT